MYYYVIKSPKQCLGDLTLDLPNKMHLYKQKQKVPFYEPMTLVKSYNNTNIGEY
jgi:hypothetical protein